MQDAEQRDDPEVASLEDTEPGEFVEAGEAGAGAEHLDDRGRHDLQQQKDRHDDS